MVTASSFFTVYFQSTNTLAKLLLFCFQNVLGFCHWPFPPARSFSCLACISTWTSSIASILTFPISSTGHTAALVIFPNHHNHHFPKSTPQGSVYPGDNVKGHFLLCKAPCRLSPLPSLIFFLFRLDSPSYIFQDTVSLYRLVDLELTEWGHLPLLPECWGSTGPHFQ